MRATPRSLIVGLFFWGLSSCGEPFAPFSLDASFALPAGTEVPVGDGVATTTWVIADTLRFSADGTGEQRGTLETRLGTVTRQPTARSFRYVRAGPRLAVTWLFPCSPACDVVLITTYYDIDGTELRGAIGAEAVLYRRVR